MEQILGHLHLCLLPSFPGCGAAGCHFSKQARHSLFSGCETGMWPGFPCEPVRFTQNIYTVFTCLRFPDTECLQEARKKSFDRSTVYVSSWSDKKRFLKTIYMQNQSAISLQKTGWLRHLISSFYA